MSMALQSTRTLLLSNAYEPLRAISLKKAMNLLFKGKVEVIEEYDWNIVPSPSQIEADVEVQQGSERKTIKRTMVVFKAPAVVRLLTSFIRRKHKVKFSRINVYARDKYMCQYCGEKKRLADLSYDHVIPRRLGGNTSWTNIVSACVPCNLKKGGRTPEQAGMKLLKAPAQPTWQAAIVINVSSTSVPDAWRDYLYWTGELVQD